MRFVLHGSISDADRARLAHVDPAGRVELAGAYAHADLPGVLAGIDVAVVPSAVWEGAPLTVGEARAARLPVIASRMGGLAEGVRDGVDGLLVDGWSETGLAEAMQRLVDRPFLLDAMAAGDRGTARRSPTTSTTSRPATPRAPPRTPSRRRRWRCAGAATSTPSRASRASTPRSCAGSATASRSTSRPTTGRPAPPRRRVRPPSRCATSGRRRSTIRAVGRLVLIQPWEFGSIPPRLGGAAAGRVDELWVPSEYVRQMYVDGGVPADRVHVVPNGVDLDVVPPRRPALRARRADGDALPVRRRHDLPQGRRRAAGAPTRRRSPAATTSRW